MWSLLFLPLIVLLFIGSVALAVVLVVWRRPIQTSAQGSTAALGRIAWVGVALASVLAGFAALFFGPHLLAKLASSEKHFTEVFGARPSGAIQNLLTEAATDKDSRTIYLSFSATLNAGHEVGTLISRATPTEPGDLADSAITAGLAPRWFAAGNNWSGRANCPSQRRNAYTDFNSWDVVVLIHCQSDGRVYVMARGRLN
ncbi:MAG: hypothetical protein KJZ64_12530 [Sphingomonadaceae bacterium]|nr:hypothetical protein [Sphingomonadaceae bacterium]